MQSRDKMQPTFLSALGNSAFDFSSEFHLTPNSYAYNERSLNHHNYRSFITIQSDFVDIMRQIHSCQHRSKVCEAINTLLVFKDDDVTLYHQLTFWKDALLRSVMERCKIILFNVAWEIKNVYMNSYGHSNHGFIDYDAVNSASNKSMNFTPAFYVSNTMLRIPNPYGSNPAFMKLPIEVAETSLDHGKFLMKQVAYLEQKLTTYMLTSSSYFL